MTKTRLDTKTMKKLFNKRNIIAVIIVVAFAWIGVRMLNNSHAAAVSPPPSGGYYQLTAAGTSFKDEATCAAEVLGRNNPCVFRL